MTQKQLAGHLGFSYQQLQKVEAGANRLSASTLWMVASVLGVPLDRFFRSLTEGAAGPSEALAEAGDLVDLFLHASPPVRAAILLLLREAVPVVN